MGGGVSTNHKSLNRIELSRLGQDLFNCESFDLTPPIDPLTHLTTHQWVGVWVGVSLQIKSSKRIELS